MWGSKLRELRAIDADFFASALWGRNDLAGVTGSRLLREHDTRGWMALVRALETAGLAPDTGLLIVALDSKSEEIRSDTIWTLVRSYVAEPSTMPAHLRDVLLAERAETGSDREEFGRELARRMLGQKSAHESALARMARDPRGGSAAEDRREAATSS